MTQRNHPLLLAAIGACLLCTQAFAADKAASPAASAAKAAASPAAQPAAAPAALSPSDHIFLGDALNANQKEMDSANYAIQKATSPKVKEFAKTIVRDDTEFAAELRRVAGQTIPAPAPGTSPNPNLAELKGNDFDKAYMGMMVDNLVVAIGRYVVVSEGKHHNADVRALAAKTLPMLRKHEQSAKAIDQALPKR